MQILESNNNVNELEDLLTKHNLTMDMFNEPDRTTEYSIDIVPEILKLCGLTDAEIKMVVYGIESSTVKADIEYCSGWSESYPWYTIKNALDAYNDMVIKKDDRVEVGMKYPQFNAKQYVKKYNLSYVGRLECKHSMDHRSIYPDATIMMYDVYSDPLGNVYTFQPDRMGKGGYAGFIFNDKQTAFKFINDFLNSKTRYVKDINIISNGLGGFDKEDMDYYKERLNIIQVN